MNSQYRIRGVISALLSSILLVVLCGCSGSPQEQPIHAAYKPYRVVQACLQRDSGVTPVFDHQVVNALAQWTEQAMTVNQSGLIEYVNELSGAADAGTHTTAYLIPSFPRDPEKPASSPDNPYASSDALAKWQHTLKVHHEKLRELRAALKPRLDALRSLTPNATLLTPASLIGCINVAHLRFSHEREGQNILVLAVSMNTLPTFAPKFLAGSRVLFIRFCRSTSSCLNDTAIRDRFLAAGATSITIVDSAESQAISSPF